MDTATDIFMFTWTELKYAELEVKRRESKPTDAGVVSCNEAAGYARIARGNAPMLQTRRRPCMFATA